MNGMSNSISCPNNAAPGRHWIWGVKWGGTIRLPPQIGLHKLKHFLVLAVEKPQTLFSRKIPVLEEMDFWGGNESAQKRFLHDFIFVQHKKQEARVGACRNLFFGVFLLFLAKFTLQSSFFSKSRLFTRPLFCFLFQIWIGWLANWSRFFLQSRFLLCFVPDFLCIPP